METTIHPLACVDSRAELGDGVEIGPFAVVASDVQLGSGCRIGPHAIIGSGTRMGRDNVVFAGAFVGGESQAVSYEGEKSYLILGDRNIIREAASLNRATGEGKATRVGSDCLIMAYAHVAHNCLLGDHVILGNGATLAGCVTIENHAGVCGLSAIHQFCRIGQYAYVGGKTKVTKDIPPYMLADGHPAQVYGLNVVGLRRHGFTEETILDLRRAHKILYHSNRSLRAALEHLRETFPERPEVAALREFIAASQRGVVRPPRQSYRV